jgi:hypothetical protein
MATTFRKPAATIEQVSGRRLLQADGFHGLNIAPRPMGCRAKIRQQLQELRDPGLLLHIERGVWHLPGVGRILS